MGTLKVRDLMTDDPYRLRESDTAAAAYDLMDSKHVRHIPIVTDSNELLGVVSQRDLLRRALAHTSELPISTQREVLKSLSVGDIMTVIPETAEPDQAITEAGQLLMDNKFGCLPVVDGEELVGILTESDFVRHVVESES